MLPFLCANRDGRRIRCRRHFSFFRAVNSPQVSDEGRLQPNPANYIQTACGAGEVNTLPVRARLLLPPCLFEGEVLVPFPLQSPRQVSLPMGKILIAVGS